MISINIERCNGCGECIAACPIGALYLVDNKAAVDQRLCSECNACIATCPSEAISFARSEEYPAAESIRVPARRPEPEVIQVRTVPAPVPLRTRVLPVIGASLAWVGSEIVPRLADYFLDSLDRRAARRRDGGIMQHTSSTNSQIGRGGGGRRHRRRRRGS